MSHATRLAVLLLATLLLPACDSLTSPRAGQLGQWVDQRAAWNSKHITSYDYTLRINCFCLFEGQPYRVQVRDGAITGVLKGDGSPADTLTVRYIPTVDSLFATVRRALDSKEASVRVSYDQDLHYPTDVWIDWIPDAADDEIGYIASSLTRR